MALCPLCRKREATARIESDASGHYRALEVCAECERSGRAARELEKRRRKPIAVSERVQRD